MDFYDLIKNRISMRDYDPQQPVSDETLNRILMAGCLAPSAANRQPWRFILVSSPDWLEKVRGCYHREWFKQASHILIVKGSKSAAWTRSADGYNSIETDLTIAMEHGTG